MIMDMGIAQLTKKTNYKFGNTMQELQGGNVAKCNLTIVDASIAWLANKPMKNLGG
jgi:hypothetical protein